MGSINHLMVSFKYFLLIILGEVALYYLVSSFPSINVFIMPATILVFLIISWVLKPKVPTLIVVTILTVLYVVLSFYSDFPIYYVGYPPTFEEFLPQIGIKVAFYTFPIIAYIVINYEKK